MIYIILFCIDPFSGRKYYYPNDIVVGRRRYVVHAFTEITILLYNYLYLNALKKKKKLQTDYGGSAALCRI